MNLLVVDSVDFPFGGAHSAHVSLLMQGLRKSAGIGFLVIPYGRKREALSAAKKKYGHFESIPYFFVRDSKEIKKGFRFLDNFIAVIKTAALIYKRKKQKKLDAVILGGIVDIIRDLPIIISCTLFRIPIYFWLVEKASLNEDYRGIPGYFNYKSQQLSEKILPKISSGVIVISESLKKHYLRYLPESKILISPILVSEESYKSVSRQSFETVKEKIKKSLEGKRLLVYSGSFGEKDGIFYLIDAFAEVVKKYPDTVFVMTGKSYDAVLMDRITSAIKNHELDDKIRLVGFVNSDELLCYNTMADLLFVCRSNSPYANHGFPWKLGEYCMTGKPIIATRVSDIETYFTDNETLFIVEPNSPKAIEEKVDSIFSNYDKALEVGKKSRETAIKCFGNIEKAKEIIEFVERNNPVKK